MARAASRWMGSVAAAVPAATVQRARAALGAPEQALAGFLRKHGADREQLREEGDYWVLEKRVPGRRGGRTDRRGRPGVAAPLSLAEIDALGRHERLHLGPPAAPHPLPAGRRGGAVRPRDGEDDGHGLAAGDLTEGHRFLAPGADPHHRLGRVCRRF